MEKRNMEEQWIKIEGYPNYEVSSTGFIRNSRGTILKTWTRNGYESLTLCKDGTKKTYNVHQVVVKHFIGLCKGKVVNHKDGNKSNNRVDNLEVITYAENTRHAVDNGLAKHWRKRVYQCDLDGNIIAEFGSVREAAKITGVAEKHIPSVCNGKRATAGGFKWRHVESAEKEDAVGLPIPDHDNYLVTADGRVWSKNIQRCMKLKKLPSGYYCIKLTNNNGIKRDWYIQQLVARVHIPNPNPDTRKWVNHIDRNKSNNHVSNLEWVTQSENMYRLADNLHKSKQEELCAQLSVPSDIGNDIVVAGKTSEDAEPTAVVRTVKLKIRLRVQPDSIVNPQALS